MSGTTSRVTRAAALAHVQALITGLQKHLSGQSFTIGNVAFTTASLVLLLQSLADAIAGVITAQASARDALVKLEAVKANVGPTMSALVRIIVAMFAGDTSKLGDFGVTAPRARTPLTTEQKAAAAAKAKATRSARGTKGPKAKAEITGNVTGVEITPITAPVAAEPTAPQPAAAAPIAPAGASK